MHVKFWDLAYNIKNIALFAIHVVQRLIHKCIEWHTCCGDCLDIFEIYYIFEIYETEWCYSKGESQHMHCNLKKIENASNFISTSTQRIRHSPSQCFTREWWISTDIFSIIRNEKGNSPDTPTVMCWITYTGSEDLFSRYG